MNRGTRNDKVALAIPCYATLKKVQRQDEKNLEPGMTVKKKEGERKKEISKV